MAYQGEYFVERYGICAAEATPPIARMLEAGIPVSAGTDATRVASYNPWNALSWLVTGKTVGGLRLYPARNRLDRETALRMWTENVTWFSNEESKKGRIEVGQFADLVVPNRDYFACSEDGIADIAAALTIVGGKVVYGAGEFAAFDGTTPPPAMPDRFDASVAMPPGATPAAPDRPWHDGRLPPPAAARTIAASTATITPSPGRPGCR